MTFQRILKRWSAKRRQRSGQSWFVETEEEIVLCAIIDFGEQSRAVANRSLHAGVVKTLRISSSDFQTDQTSNRNQETDSNGPRRRALSTSHQATRRMMLAERISSRA